jgi:hypothetical protein
MFNYQCVIIKSAVRKRNIKVIFFLIIAFQLLFVFGITYAADIVPNEIQQPGTQPQEINSLESPDKCDNCHTPSITDHWRGNMMANAGRDPIFWATVAIAEQDFDGVGDLCIRCHSTGGWLAGRSTPTDGSSLSAGDGDGVECDFCHKMTNPDNSEHMGEQFPPFIANNFGDPGSDPGNVIAYFGSGMASIWGSSDKVGPYSDAEARHQWMQSQFHRSPDFCGTCHDVSNSAVGDLAHNNGTQLTADPVTSSGILGGPVEDKAAFNNVPYKYGIVERTFSEYKSGLLSQTMVSDYNSLPVELRTGAITDAYQNALLAGTGGNYEDGTPRYFSCQTCHMRPVTGLGCDKNGVPIRNDLPLHDMTGGNYWMPIAIQYLDNLGKLRLGSGLTTVQSAALVDGAVRARMQLNMASSLVVNENTLTVTNLTGHKLITGYPEGRRMWLNIKWYDSNNKIIREDGEYGSIGISIANPAGGPDIQIESILDLHDPNTKIYEAHYGMTQEWAAQLMQVNGDYYGSIILDYDRYTGALGLTIAELAQASLGTEYETFHFVLNNTVIKDNRIPPYGMNYEEARKRNALPVPADQYGNPDPAGSYNHWDEVTLNPPPGAETATVEMLYQPTSWEYIQFLYLGNNKQNAFLANEGDYMLEAWLNTGMAAPHVMASAVWINTSGCEYPPARIDGMTPVYYSKLQDAYDASGDLDIIQSHDVVFGEDLNINHSKLVKIEGGYTCDYASVTGKTTINGNMIISEGTLVIQNGTLEVL